MWIYFPLYVSEVLGYKVTLMVFFRSRVVCFVPTTASIVYRVATLVALILLAEPPQATQMAMNMRKATTATATRGRI
jgi:hypothetical protein